MKIGSFKWTSAAHKAYLDIKQKIIEAPMLKHLDLFKVFEIVFDALSPGVGGVLNQDGHPITYFSKKLNEAKQCYSTDDKEFYAVV